jgi:hypothetical protein
MTLDALTAFLWAAAGGFAGVGVRELLLQRRRRRATLYQYPIVRELDLARAMVGHVLKGGPMKVQVAVGAKMSREAWETVTYKLLDLVGSNLTSREREAAQTFIRYGGRAWSDLEQRAAAENPGALPPGAPTD